MNPFILLQSLLLMVISISAVPAFSEENKDVDTVEAVSDFTYAIGPEDSREKYRALGLFGAKSKAVVSAATYLMHKGLLEEYGRKQAEIFCLTVNKVKTEIIEEKHPENETLYYVKIKTSIKSTDFIKAEIKDRALEREETKFSYQEEMEQFLYKDIDPAEELSRAYRYVRKRQTRLAIIYLDHLQDKYPLWADVYYVKAIAFFVMHDMERMKTALETSCSLAHQEACNDLERLSKGERNQLNLKRY